MTRSSDLESFPNSLAQGEPCLRVLMAGSLIGSAPYDEVGCSGDHALNLIAVAPAVHS